MLRGILVWFEEVVGKWFPRPVFRSMESLAADLVMAREIAWRIGASQADDGGMCFDRAVLVLDDADRGAAIRALKDSGHNPIRIGPGWHLEVPLQAQRNRRKAQVLALVEALRFFGWDAHHESGWSPPQIDRRESHAQPRRGLRDRG